MKSGKCPKCQSTDIYAHIIGKTKGFKRFMSMNGYDYYLCGTCGYSEKYYVGTRLKDAKKKLTLLRKLKSETKRKNDDS